MPPRVSLTMIVKNEEANLPACLDSVAGLFHETVVVDTGSTDRTKEIAARYGARVFDFPWVDDFAAARNESLRHATGDWVFWFDADDRLDEANRARLRALLAGLKDENAAYGMKYLGLSHGGEGAGTLTVYLRLFRNHPQIRWQYRAHEQIRPAVERLGGEVRSSEVVVTTIGYQDPILLRRKQERNLRLLQLDLKEHPDDPYLLYHVGRNLVGAGRPTEGLPLLRRCLERARPDAFFLRALFGQLARGHHQLGRRVEALAACRQGQARFADDAELLFMEATILTEMGDLSGAESCLLRLLHPGARFVCVDVDLCGPKARHALAQLYRRLKRDADAEAQWRALLAERPDFALAWLALGDLYLAQGRLPELEQDVRRLAADPRRAAEAAVLRARLLLARGETAEARRVLEEAVPLAPRSVWLRAALVQVLSRQDPDGPALKAALNDLLTLDPGNAQGRAALAALGAEKRPDAASALNLDRKGAGAEQGVRVFYINLKRRTDRDDLFLSRNAGVADFRRVDAVEGQGLRVEDLAFQGLIRGPLGYTPGALGNALSHKNLWARCVADGTALTVAEDDAILNRRFAEKAVAVLSRLPSDWDFIRWGWNFDSILHVEILGGLVQAVMGFNPPSLGPRAAEFPEKVYESLPMRLIGAFGNTCYTISPKGAQRLIGLCFPLKNEDISIPGLRRAVPNSALSVVMNKHFRALRAYAAFPPLAWTENDPRSSDVAPGA